MVVAIYEITIVGVAFTYEMSTHRSQSAATVYGAQHVAAGDVNTHVAAHNTCRQRLAGESAAAAEDIAVHVAVAHRSDLGSCTAIGGSIGVVDVAADSHMAVNQHVTVLTTTED